MISFCCYFRLGFRLAGQLFRTSQEKCVLFQEYQLFRRTSSMCRSPADSVTPNAGLLAIVTFRTSDAGLTPEEAEGIFLGVSRNSRKLQEVSAMAEHRKIRRILST